MVTRSGGSCRCAEASAVFVPAVWVSRVASLLLLNDVTMYNFP